MTIAVDLAKHVFELAVADAHWHLVARHRFTRRQFERFLARQAACHLVMEACGTAHHWGRVAQGHGHRVTLLPAQYVRPYARGNKTDRTDADALLEAVRSGRIVPVAIKTVAQQELVALHRIRAQWMASRTARINALRGFLRELGILLPRGAHAAVAAVPALVEDADTALPGRLREALLLLYTEVRDIEARVAVIEQRLTTVVTTDPVAQRLLPIPGIGVLTASALLGTVGHIHGFKRGRHFASWLGLTPREHSSGTRRTLGRITKRGDVYLRCLLTHGARSALLAAQRRAAAGKPLTRLQQWAVAVADRRGHNKATLALANKLARIVWAVWRYDVSFAAAPAFAA
jgi:transposase